MTTCSAHIRDIEFLISYPKDAAVMPAVSTSPNQPQMARAIAQDTEENLKEWIPGSIEFVTQQWKDSNLGHRMDLLRRRFEKLRAAIVEIDLFQTLPVGCKYLGE
jgi:hypothetical protein